MQALILAAGMGRRLGKVTENKTKGMVEVCGKTLLERSLDILTSFKEIDRIILVIGYKGDGVKEKIGNKYNNIEVKYIENKDYNTTNNIYSLFLANELFSQDDTILLESDLIFEKNMIAQLIENKKDKNLVLVAPWEPWMDGTIVSLNENFEIEQFISKQNIDYSNIKNCFKTVNIYKFSKEFINNTYIPFLEAYCKAFGLNEYYENVLGVLAFIQKKHLKASIVDKNSKWYEIDDMNDLDIATTLFSNDSHKFASRFGGFWRFNKLKDFCYLVNPYFPSKQMNRAFQMVFSTLISEYPSTMTIQKKLAGNMFECSDEHIIVGNGASELINTLFSVLKYEKIGITLPTFQEYTARMIEEKIEYFLPENKNFSYTKNDIIKFSEKIDTFVLINPDNPSGNFIDKQNLLEILEHFKKTNKTLIIDESFVDFADKNLEQTLFDDQIFEKYPNLILIKSIGKSFGVPGIRLGVLATGNKELLEKIAKQLPIWNIGSFGEFFLQIFPQYKKDYISAVNQLIEQRECLYEELKKITYLKPIKSKANFLLCEVKPPLNNKILLDNAIKEHILLKDCSTKTGFNKQQYLRISIRDEKDNKQLIDFFKKQKTTL